MFNKKRIAAFAVTAAMVMGTWSTAAFAEEQGTSNAYQVDASTIVFSFDGEAGWVDYTEVPVEGTEGQPFAKHEAVATIEVLGADCELPERVVMTAVIDGQTYNSSQVDPERVIPTGNQDALGHDFVEQAPVIDKMPDCTTAGSEHISYICSRCGKEDETQRQDIPLDPAHQWGEDQTRVTNLDNVQEAEDGSYELIDLTLDGSYDIETFHVCEICEEEEVVDTETVKIPAKKVVEAVIVDQEKIADDLIGMTMAQFQTEYPDYTDIELEKCSVPGRYKVAYRDASGNDVSYKWFDVPAHHVESVAIEFKNAADAELCTVDQEKLTVRNNSCNKEVTYYEVTHCSAAGCPNKACKNADMCAAPEYKEVSRVEKTAAPEGPHRINLVIEQEVKALKKLTPEEYDQWVERAKDKSNYIKVSTTATCTEAGETTFTFLCKVCGAEAKSIAVPTKALGHIKGEPIGEDAVKPTCESTGTYNVVTYCERCGEELERRDGILIPRLKHTNEESVATNGIGVPSKSDKGAYIKFIGDKVVDPYDGSYMRERRNETFEDYIGYELERNEFGVKAILYTNCDVCHHNELPLEGKHVELTIASISKQSAAGEAGSITINAKYTTEDKKEVTATYTVPYFTTMNSYNGRVEKDPANGLARDENGKYHYYNNGEVDTTKNGIVSYQGGDFFVANGDLCDGANGLNLNSEDGKWYFLSNGQVQRGYNGLALYDGEWFYLTNGVLDTNINGLVPYNGGTFLFSQGRLVKEHNGLWQDFDGSWYFLAKGQLQNYTGVAMYDNAFFYIRAGKLATDYNGTVEYDGATFKVVAGQLYAA